MKIKMKQLLESKIALETLFEATDIPMVISYRISNSIIPVVEKYINQFEQIKNSLYKKYGHLKTPEDDLWEILEENLEEFEKEFQLLLDEDVNFDFNEIKVSDLDRCSSISPVVLYTLSWLIVEK